MEKMHSHEIEEALGKPVAAEFSEGASKIRRNLLIASIAAISIVQGGISIGPSVSILGITLMGLTTDKVKIAVLSICLYTFLHFLWCAFDAFHGWRLRITGTRDAFFGSFSKEGADYQPDQKQSTLYNYWIHKSKNLNKKEEDLKRIIGDLKIWIEKEKISDAATPVTSTHTSRLNQLTTKVETISAAIDVIQHTLEDPRIPVSLQRFDNAFKLFLVSQNLRWALIEAGLPLFLGLFGIAMLIISLIK